MTTHRERTGDDHGEEQNDAVPDVTGDVTDNSYIKADRSNEDIEIPVVSDETARSELDDQPPPNSDDQLGASVFVDCVFSSSKSNKEN